MASNPADTGGSDLKVDVEQPKSWARRLKITVSAERVEQQRREVAQRLAGRLRLPGFRQGKIPAHVLEKKYGPAIQQEVLEKVIGDAYREAITREGFQPITQGSVENLEYQPGAELKFDVEFEVQPQIELDRLGGFQLRREKPALDAAEVDRVLGRLREERAEWDAVEAEAPAAGDMVSVEITPLDEEGQPKAGARNHPYQIQLGRDEARPEVEEAIRSLRPGEETEFQLELPSEGGEASEEGAAGGGSSHRARVKLLEVKRPRYPEIDDELARSVGEFESLAALRERIGGDLQRQLDAEAEGGVRRQLMDQILDANPFEVPDTMVDRYLDQLFRPRGEDEKERVAEARQHARPAAERALKRMLVVERVAEMEGLRATPREVEARIEALAAERGMPVEEARKQLQRSQQIHQLEDEITEEKVFAYLMGLSEVS